jgi:hypothetical protein
VFGTGGPFLHTRCRLTPFPVNQSLTPNMIAQANYSQTLFAQYRCLDEINYDYYGESDDIGLAKRDSPWHHPQPECYWPIDGDDASFCALSSTGFNQCPGVYSTADNTVELLYHRWCGSNYDAVGNARFSKSSAYLDIYIENLGWGE